MKLSDRVYSDVWGPSRHPTINKKPYYVLFIEDYLWESVLCLMNTKDKEVFQKYKPYVMMHCQRNGHTKALISDRGSEYTNNGVEKYLAHQGMKC